MSRRLGRATTVASTTHRRRTTTLAPATFAHATRVPTTFTPAMRALTLLVLTSLVAGCATPSGLHFGDDSKATTTPVFLDDRGNSASAVPPVDASNGDSFDADVADSSGAADNGNPRSVADAATVNDVAGALTDLLTAWVDCFHAPADCAPNPITAPDSPERTRLAEAAAFYAAERIRTRPDEGRLEWGVESVSLTGDDRARVVACEYDTRVFFDSSMADTELGDIIFDTTIWTRRVEWTLSRHDGDWKLWSRRIDRRSPVARFCVP